MKPDTAFKGMALAILCIPWLLWNHAVAPALGFRQIGYWLFVGVWAFIVIVVRILRGK